MTLIIRPGDPRWSRTFPFLVKPQANEWLPGLLLRVDHANLWEAGTTASFISRSAVGLGLVRPGLYVTARTFDLVRLADALAVSLEQVRATTFTPELEILAGPRPFTSKLLGPSRPLRVCPLCVADNNLLCKWSALALLDMCPTHHVRWRETCTCGEPLRLAALKTPPFVCGGCRLPWAKLAGEPCTPDVISANARVIGAYQTLLGQTGRDPLGQLRRRLAHELRQLNPGARGQALVTVSGTISVAWFIEAALRLGVDIDRSLVSAVEVSRPPCGNNACPFYSRIDADNICKSGRWHGRQEYYCTECGARFIDGRLIMAFDYDHGSDDLHPTFVGKARARLAGWRRRVHAECQEMLESEEPISVEAVFRRAKVPLTANLRARRLGLVLIVEGYAAELEAQLPTKREVRWATRKHMYRRVRRGPIGDDDSTNLKPRLPEREVPQSNGRGFTK